METINENTIFAEVYALMAEEEAKGPTAAEVAEWDAAFAPYRVEASEEDEAE